MSLHMKNFARAGMVAIAFATGIAFAGSAMASTVTPPPPPPTTVAGVGHVIVSPACEGAVGLDFTGYNDVPGSGAITLMVHDNLTGADTTMADISNGTPVTSGILLDPGQAYSLTATGPGDYSHLFSGTLSCGSTPTPTAPAVVPVTVKVAAECVAGKYPYAFTNPNDVAVMVRSSGFDDAVRTETAIPAGGTVTVTSTLSKLYYETYVDGTQVAGSATFVAAPADLKCSIVVPPTPAPSSTTPAVAVPASTTQSTPAAVAKAKVVGPKIVTDYVSTGSDFWTVFASAAAVLFGAALIGTSALRRKRFASKN